MSLLDLFKKKGSGDVAKDRLKLLLVSDRANCSPEVMEMIKNDIIKVISKYMVIDAEGLDIQGTNVQAVLRRAGDRAASLARQLAQEPMCLHG